MTGFFSFCRAVTSACLLCAVVAVGSMADSRADRIAASPQQRDGTFVNSQPTERMGMKGLWDGLKYYFGSRDDCCPPHPLPSTPVDLESFMSDSTLGAIWLGHATVLIRIDGVTLLTDPVFDDHTPLLIGKRPRFQPPAIRRDSLPKIDAVIISHDHYDHLEKSTVRALMSQGTKFVVPLGVGKHLDSWGLPDSQLVELDWWEEAEIGSVRLACTPARHFSGRSIFSMNETLWASWCVIGKHQRLFYSGDTGYTDAFTTIGDRYGPFDIAMIQVGAHGENWKQIHLTPREAVQVNADVRGERLLPVHWGTFDLALHPWDEPIIELLKAAGDSVMVLTPRLGEVVTPSDTPATDRWWELAGQKSD